MTKPASTTRTTNRHTPDVRRMMVLEAAARLIADEGLLAATMRAIAAEAQISLGTLTHHFASVDQLLAEALELASVRFTERLAKRNVTGNAATKLQALADAVMPDNQAALRQWRLWLQFWSRAVYDPSLAGTHNRRYRAWKATVADLINEGIKDGSLRPTLNAAEATENLVALIDGVCFQVAMKGSGMTAAQGKRVVKRGVQALTDQQSSS